MHILNASQFQLSFRWRTDEQSNAFVRTSILLTYRLNCKRLVS